MAQRHTAISQASQAAEVYTILPLSPIGFRSSTYSKIFISQTPDKHRVSNMQHMSEALKIQPDQVPYSLTSTLGITEALIHESPRQSTLSSYRHLNRNISAEYWHSLAIWHHHSSFSQLVLLTWSLQEQESNEVRTNRLHWPVMMNSFGEQHTHHESRLFHETDKHHHHQTSNHHHHLHPPPDDQSPGLHH